MKLVKLLANLGYGSRKEVQKWIRAGAVTDSEGRVLKENEAPPHESILLRGEPLDPSWPLVLVLNKPDGYTCSSEDPGATIYDLLPPRFEARNPMLHPVGRLDKDTRGLLLMTDDGKLSHRIIHPKSGCVKTYRVWLDRPLAGSEVEAFASGTMLLKSETKPLLPARLEAEGQTQALVTLHEGRYHQIRRMFAAVGNHVIDLQRISIGGFQLPDDLPEGEWRPLRETELQSVFGAESAQ